MKGRMALVYVLAWATPGTGCKCQTPGTDTSTSTVTPEVRMTAIAAARGTIRDVQGRALATTRFGRGEVESGRIYPMGQVAAHVVGHMAPVDDTNPAAGMAGASGLEKAFETTLAGTPGWEKTLLTVEGEPMTPKQVAAIGAGPLTTLPRDGLDVHTTLDADLMTIVHKAFVGHEEGAAVVLEVDSGRVRALYSRPSFDPTFLTRGGAPDRGGADRPGAPSSMATGMAFLPGSTMKPITALAGLASGTIDAGIVVPCKGSLEYEGGDMSCHGKHGAVDVRRGIVTSCNVFFYKLGMGLPAGELARWSKDLGFGRATGIDLPDEAPGHVTDTDQSLPVPARLSMDAAMACGHGGVKVTLLQLALAYAAIANGGTLYGPLLVERLAAPDGSAVQTFDVKVAGKMEIPSGVTEQILAALTAVVADPEGTAHAAAREDMAVAGKSGTVSRATSQVDGSAPANDTFFVALAPAQDPRLVAAVLVRGGETGASTAAPIAISILADYLGGLY